VQKISVFLPSFDCGKQSLIPRGLRPSRLSGDNSELRPVLLIEVDFSFLLVAYERLALCSCATRGIRNSQERKDRPKNNSGVPRALGFPNGVLACFCLVVSDGRNNQICAVDGDHASLDETRSRVGLLNGGVDTHDSDDDTQNQVESDKEPVEGAS